MNIKPYISTKILKSAFLTAMFGFLSFIPVRASANSDTLALLVPFRSVAYLDPIQFATTAATDTVDSGLTVDDRALRIDQYFEKRGMPLAGYGAKFVEVAAKCNIDWRLLPAIGVRESSGGKNQYNNNPFGWGSAKIKFKDFSEAIDVVSDNLCGLNDATAKYYKDNSTYQKLWYYNGTVMRSYPDEVIDIMEMM